MIIVNCYCLLILFVVFSCLLSSFVLITRTLQLKGENCDDPFPLL